MDKDKWQLEVKHESYTLYTCKKCRFRCCDIGTAMFHEKEHNK